MQRVAVIGCVGAGKSTLARSLGEILGIDVIHLDRYFWRDGTYRITGHRGVERSSLAAGEFRAVQAELMQSDAWILDGDLSNLDLRLEFADTVVFLDLPRRVCIRGLIARHNRGRADYPDGVTEGLGWLWLLMRWVMWTYPRRRRPGVLRRLAGAEGRVKVVHLRNRAEAREFLRALKAGS